MRRFINLFILFLHPFIFSEGFYGDTLVKVIDHYAPIQNLKVGDYILGYDFVKNRTEAQKITKMVTVEAKKGCRVFLYNLNFLLGLDQQIFIKSKERWVKCQDLDLNVNISFFDPFAQVLKIKILDGDIKFYQITTYPNHNFFIEGKVLVRDFIEKENRFWKENNFILSVFNWLKFFHLLQ